MRARGLKHDLARQLHVASRPMRARGLKPIQLRGVARVETSRPMRARGLKQYQYPLMPILGGRAPCGRVD